tara:strand:- start:150 stop:386 length:237 start_codon:yes stop_codon:yes gene_type:complete
MNSNEFYLWLNGYLEALESEGITECKIKNIREKMATIKSTNAQQERIVFGPNVNSTPQNYARERTFPTPPPPSGTRVQ